MQTEERRKILIVDDDPMVLKVIRSYLKDRYKEALKFFSMQIPDVVLLDYMMPGMDGPEVFRRMQEDERTQGIPVFFMTAVTDRDRVLECMEMNPEEYLVKPVSSSKLLKKLSDLFEKES